uniref:Uncharacterized protein n=1 Tax=Solanum lycopersicum TaxID=4081 RepID=A0A3Q7HZ45_SOLLC
MRVLKLFYKLKLPKFFEIKLINNTNSIEDLSKVINR